jgi:hypothetical protein
MGVERVDRRSSAKATKKRIDRGVAGRSMLAKGVGHWRSPASAEATGLAAAVQRWRRRVRGGCGTGAGGARSDS